MTSVLRVLVSSYRRIFADAYSLRGIRIRPMFHIGFLNQSSGYSRYKILIQKAFYFQYAYVFLLIS